MHPIFHSINYMPRLPQHLRKFQQGSSQSHRQRSPGILAYLVTGWQPPRGKHGLSTNILLWIPELSTRGHRSTMIPLLRGLRGTIATLPCSRLPLTPVGQNEKRVAVNKRVSTGCFLVLEYWSKYPRLPKSHRDKLPDRCIVSTMLVTVIFPLQVKVNAVLGGRKWKVKVKVA